MDPKRLADVQRVLCDGDAAKPPVTVIREVFAELARLRAEVERLTVALDDAAAIESTSIADQNELQAGSRARDEMRRDFKATIERLTRERYAVVELEAEVLELRGGNEQQERDHAKALRIAGERVAEAVELRAEFERLTRERDEARETAARKAFELSCALRGTTTALVSDPTAPRAVECANWREVAEAWGWGEPGSKAGGERDAGERVISDKAVKDMSAVVGALAGLFPDLDGATPGGEQP
jgi:hypothetical protein